MPISRWRAGARAISRLATFAHAMSSTRPTSNIRTTSGVENWLRKEDSPLCPGSTSSFVSTNQPGGAHCPMMASATRIPSAAADMMPPA